MSGYQFGTGSNWIYHMLLILPWHMSIDTEQMGNPSPILIPPVASCFHTRRRTSSRPVTQSASPSRCQATLSTMAPHLSKKPFHLACYFPPMCFHWRPIPRAHFRVSRHLLQLLKWSPQTSQFCPSDTSCFPLIPAVFLIPNT